MTTLRSLALLALLLSGCGDKSDDTASENDTDNDTDTTADVAICPGSEAYCSAAESHCDDDGLLQICQYMPEDNCLEHFEVSCDEEVGAGSECVTVSDTEAGCTHVPPAETRVRFLNLQSKGISMHLIDADGDEVSSSVIYERQGTAYTTIEGITGLVTAVAKDAGGIEVGRLKDFGTIEEGKSYTFSADALGALLVEDDYDGIDSDETRVNLISVQGETLDVAVNYSVGWSGSEWKNGQEEWELREAASLDYGEGLSADYAFSYLVHLDLAWDVGPDTVVATWNFSYFVQDHHGSLVNAYVWYDGSCDRSSPTCAPQLLGLADDASSFVVEGGEPDWQ
jgi:hypothetical protein